MRYFDNLRITTKFIVWFLLISLVPLTIAIYVSYTSAREALRGEVEKGLVAIADNKFNQIETYLAKSKRDVDSFSDLPEVLDAFEKIADVLRKSWRDSPEHAAVEREFRPMFTYYQRSYGYDDILLIDPKGEVIFSVKGSSGAKSVSEMALYKNSELANVFLRAQKSQETEVSNFEYDPQTKSASVFIAAPVLKGADLAGTVIAQVGPQGIRRFAEDYLGLGETGETIIVSKIGDEAVCVTPLRFDPEAAFKRKIKIGSEAGSDIQKSVQGERGLGIATDYRKREVLSAWRYLPTFRLGMVVKIDTEEIFASATRLRNTLVGISVSLLMLVVVAAILIARSISSPIKALTEISNSITSGDLTARAHIRADDEIGKLAYAFNQMTSSLIEAKAHVEEKRAELEEQKRLLEEANKELDSFVYTVSHDLRSPLHGIDGFVRLIEEQHTDKLEDKVKDYLRRIRMGANRMNELIDDLLTLSRISRIKNPYEDVDMNELVDSIVKRLEFDIKEHKVELVVAQKLPLVHCDRIKIGEVFLNLINNAIKFSSKNRDSNPKVEIGYHDKGDAHEFYVRDNGIGIDKQHHSEIFGMFKRLHRQDEYEGTGAGLAIVKRIIDDHGGSVWVDSEPGKGATFYFAIPKMLRA